MGRRSPRLLPLLGAVACFAPPAALALEAVVLRDDRGEYALGRSIGILEDPEGRWSIEEVASPALADAFVTSRSAVPNYGASSSVLWVRLRLHDAGAQQRSWLLEVDWPVTDRVDLYAPSPGGGFAVQRAGDTLPVSRWPIPDRNPLFRIAVDPGATDTFYVRIQSEDTLLVPLTLWDEASFQHHRARETFLYAGYYGVILGLVIYHGLLFLLLRDRNYLYYVLSFGSFALWSLSLQGSLSYYLWPESPWLKNRAHAVSGIAALLFSVAFTRSFLMMKILVPRLDAALRALALWLGLLLVWPLFGGLLAFNRLATVTGIAGGFLVVASGFAVLREGYRPARYYLFTWCWVAAAALLQGARALGIAPSNLVTQYPMELAVLLSTISIALLLRQTQAMQEKLRRYVPGAVAEELGAGHDVAAAEREVSVLFVDIRGYAGFAENRSAEEIFSTLNRYTEAVSRVVGCHGGSVVEFGGDGMMALFGAPGELAHKEREAVEAGRQILLEVQALPVEGFAAGQVLRVGVGIATGPAFVGPIRSADRLIWSAVGNTTNLASRLQALTRELDAALVIDAMTFERLNVEGAEFELLPDLAIRGRSRSEDVYMIPAEPAQASGATSGSWGAPSRT